MVNNQSSQNNSRSSRTHKKVTIEETPVITCTTSNGGVREFSKHCCILMACQDTQVMLCEKGGGLNAFAKSIDSCQPAQSAQADLGRNFSLSLNFFACQRMNISPESNG